MCSCVVGSRYTKIGTNKLTTESLLIDPLDHAHVLFSPKKRSKNKVPVTNRKMAKIVPQKIRCARTYYCPVCQEYSAENCKTLADLPGGSYVLIDSICSGPNGCTLRGIRVHLWEIVKRPESTTTELFL